MRGPSRFLPPFPRHSFEFAGFLPPCRRLYTKQQMALVKKSKIGARAKTVSNSVSLAQPARPVKGGARPTKGTRLDAVSERIAAATEELASGLTEAAAATKELGRSMEQIASGAEEAAGASQEQSVAIKQIVASLSTARVDAEASARRTQDLAVSLAEASTRIATSVRAIERGAQRQNNSIPLIAELDRQAKDIGEITRVVSRISDQTNLLALNAAIEAARAGEQGRGFAVVADEVRNLAGMSDRSAREVRELTDAIQKEVSEVRAMLEEAAATALREGQAAASIVGEFELRRQDMARIGDGNRSILEAAIEAERAAIEAQKGAEQVASAAEEQSSGVAEAQVAVDQQAESLSQGQIAAQALAKLAHDVRAGGTRASAEQIAASSEELSASIQELSSAATEIMAAVDQINRAAQVQSSATQQTSAAINQIENSARLAEDNCRLADERVRQIETGLGTGIESVERLIVGVNSSSQATQTSVAAIKRVEAMGRRIHKIVEAIALIAVQTSMLAVSGAVEAARAGESGKGFAVVSNDIRNLSRDASGNVDRARDTVLGILDQIATLKSDLEQIVSAAEIEVQNNRAVSISLQQVSSDLASLRGETKSILDGAGNILAATTEISKAARQIAAAAEQASAASRQSATAAAQQASSVEDLAAAIEEIASLADELKAQST
jgi:methyl-accepting chemotaxis protein